MFRGLLLKKLEVVALDDYFHYVIFHR
jgi:hypothetical protein